MELKNKPFGDRAEKGSSHPRAGDVKGRKMEYEYNVVIPSLNTTIYMQDGCDNMTAQDYALGYEGYVDYDIEKGVNEGDGGMLMYKEYENWTDAIPEVICFALGLDKCPPYELKEVA